MSCDLRLGGWCRAAFRAREVYTAGGRQLERATQMRHLRILIAFMLVAAVARGGEKDAAPEPDFSQINWDFLVVNDPGSERFNIDIDDQGRDTLWGRATRNLAEEERALRAGLAPGQARKGLGLTREVIAGLEYFAKTLDLKTITLEALFYHNAIV